MTALSGAATTSWADSLSVLGSHLGTDSHPEQALDESVGKFKAIMSSSFSLTFNNLLMHCPNVPVQRV